MTAEDLRDRANAAGARTDKPTNGDNAGTEVEHRGPSLVQLINQLKPELANALPRHVSVDRVARIAVTALRRTPKLNQCSPESFLGALMTASQLGLEVNTPAGEAYLIPYGKECTLVVGYQGIVKLFWQHPQAKHIDAQAVYEHDEFDYAYGLNPFLTHKPARRPDRGDVIAYYAVATLSNGGSAFAVLTPEEAKTLRNGKVGPKGDIADPQRWMERKTALKQMLKLVPKTVELQTALLADEQVRTNYAAKLDEIEVSPTIIDVAPEPATEQPPTTGDGAESAQPPAEEQGASDGSAGKTQNAGREPAVDACPACGDIPSHPPTECPMAAELDAAVAEDREQ